MNIRGVFALLLTGAMIVFMVPDTGQSSQMTDETTGSTSGKSLAELSELQKFARCFTANWLSHGSSFLAIANEYIERLPPERKAVLAKEFRAFLYESGADSDEVLLQLWYAQGAEAWDFDLTVRPVMWNFYWMMDPKAPEFDSPSPNPVGGGQVSIGLKPRRQRD